MIASLRFLPSIRVSHSLSVRDVIDMEITSKPRSAKARLQSKQTFSIPTGNILLFVDHLVTKMLLLPVAVTEYSVGGPFLPFKVQTREVQTLYKPCANLLYPDTWP